MTSIARKETTSHSLLAIPAKRWQKCMTHKQKLSNNYQNGNFILSLS